VGCQEHINSEIQIGFISSVLLLCGGYPFYNQMITKMSL